jgi:alpha-tubulin suppressor-like RCC1 family protein
MGCITNCAVSGDADRDGFAAISCGGDDCDDADANRFPGNPEVCDDGHDEDCDLTTYGVMDADSDSQTSSTCCNDRPGAAPLCGPDCDDARAQTAVGAAETCNMVDDDCDGTVDEDSLIAGFEDLDRDGVGNSARPRMACAGADVFSVTGGDCDDTQALRSPRQAEVCDSADNDCDADVDEDTVAINWYRDSDRDGFGDVNAPAPNASCAPPMGYVLLPLDCDDKDATQAPGATERCNNADDDCDGRVDEGACTLPDGGVLDAGVGLGFDAGFVDPCEGCMWRDACMTGCDDPVRLGVGQSHTCVVTENGNVYCWGTNYFGQVGQRASNAYVRPVKVTLPAPAAQVVAGSNFTCARLVDGRAYCWGHGGDGALGDGPDPHEDCDVGGPDCSPDPVQVSLPAGTLAMELGAGQRFACARLDDGSVACWGSNGSGQVGNGTAGPTDVPTPTRVLAPSGETGALAGAIALSVGYENACVLRGAGQPWCWGQNYRDQLGSGSSIIPTPERWRAGVALRTISVAWQSICGVTYPGVLVCMGDNNGGQLGLGDVTPTTSADPVMPTWGTAIGYTDGGAYHRCVVGWDNMARCVGGDEHGQLGDGVSVPPDTCAYAHPCATTPVAVDLGPVSDLDTYSEVTCAIAADGVYCWGPSGGGVPDVPTDATAPVLMLGP